MKNLLFSLLCLALLLSLFLFPEQENGLGDLSLSSFSRLFESRSARQVFDLDEEEAVAVFGSDGEAVWL